eukprot:c24678_g1_i1 orf=298-1485(+)
MVVRLRKLYEKWEKEDDVHMAILQGAGGTFCSGADVKMLFELGTKGNFSECKAFFRELYLLSYTLNTYEKITVALMDGAVMGGAFALNMLADFRIAAEQTVFSVPETQMGFHPDAGGSYMLSKLLGSFGEYLALTGECLDATDMCILGFINGYIQSKNADEVVHQLHALNTDDPEIVEHILHGYNEGVYKDPDSCLHRIESINNCFSKETVEDIIHALELEAHGRDYGWYRDVIDNIKAASPLCQKIALRSIREARLETLPQCLKREYRLSCRLISGAVSHDFYEGVRARHVDKDQMPRWYPPHLELVTSDMVDHYFQSLGEEELQLPVEEREGIPETLQGVPHHVEEYETINRLETVPQQSIETSDILEWATGAAYARSGSQSTHVSQQAETSH